MDNMNPITNDDIVGIVIGLIAFIGVIIIIMCIFAIIPDKRSEKFYAECESNNGVVVIDGRGNLMCIKKTAVIDI